MFQAMSRVDPATTVRKKRSSSLAKISRNLRVSSKKYTAKFTENSRMNTVIMRSMATLP